jgi:hypothetical protein
MTNQWKNFWIHLEQNISNKLNAEIKIKLKRQAQKIKKNENKEG